tara:strand:- start:347 stop:568 length:222 start_codon:yes stop_codon:yes gene_type:complete
MPNSNPTVSVISYTNGGVPLTMQAATPADIAKELSIGLQDVEIHVEGQSVMANHKLRDGDMVDIQRGSVKSGS